VSFRTVLLGVLLLILLGGGALAWKGWDAVSGFVAEVEAKQEICSTLDDAERLDLLGVETPTKLLNVEGSLDPYTCRWATKDYKTVVAFVEAVSAPADEWAVEARNTLASSAAAQDPMRASRLLKAAGKPPRTAADGCRFARVLFEATGAPRGAKRVVGPSAMATGAPMMMAQSCVDGTYSAVLVTAPGLELDRSLARKTAQALRTVEKRLG
jgi:hypothetical protein